MQGEGGVRACARKRASKAREREREGLFSDTNLEKFSCIVVDEAHERSLYTDLLLGMIKRCMKKRPELRVIITSATIDPEVFVKFFGGNCPVMKISGRTFPVEVVWEDADNEETDFDNYEDEAVKKAIEIHMNEPPGDILVFLTSRIEIEKCCESFEQKMRTKNRTDFQCFPLHGQLQPDEQQKVFEPLGRNKRKIVFATNCAETSITIDGIKYVVDTGVAKEMRYDAKKNVNSLSVTIISKSSADQRKGRAGRTAPGKCYRLYSQRSYNDMDAISLPEILKTHLGQALLKLAELGIGPDMYDFVQSPSPDAISAALESLVQLGAMENGKITETGRWMARLPFDPKLGLLTLLGKNEDILYDAIALAAVINAGSGVFYRGTTPEAQKKLDKAKSKFSSAGGDFLTSLKVYKEWQMVPERQKARWCMDNSINAKVVSQSFLSTWVGTKRFYIGDKLVEMRKDFKKADSLYLKGLPDEVTEDVVKRCLLRSVAQDENAKGIVKKVTVPRERVGNTTQKELQKLESEIRQTLKARLPTSAVKVVVRKPDFEHRSMFQAEAFFSNPVEGIKACEDFHLPNGQLVTVEPVMVNTLTIPKRVFDAYKDRYLDVENHVEGADVQIRHQAKSVLIRIKAKKPEDVIKARMFLGKAFKGDVLDCSFGPNLRHLLTAAGRKFLQQAGEEAGAYVCVDDKLYTVTTHGDEQACTEVREKIREYLLRLGNGSADEEVTLKGSDNPPGLLKALITKHGDDLDGFRSDFGLHSVTVDYRRHKLKLTGTPVKIQKAKDQIQATKNQLWATSKEAKPEEDDIECPACFCPIEISELYRLQICAHPYCRGCFSRMVTIAIKDRDLPIVCCYDGCERPLAWRDFHNLARAGQAHMIKKWAARDRSKRIGCPGCEFPIEKLEGCDKMRCSLCKTIFCWRPGELTYMQNVIIAMVNFSN
nr:hypothetical protein BaRGS_006605 [Batillaria attramentaria]